MSVQQRNNVHVSGQGPATIVFAHGFGCDQNMWRLIEPTYSSRYRCVKFDLAGAGNSDLSTYSPAKYGTLQGYADDVVEIIDEFAQGPVVFVGHSVSGMIGMLADLKKPGIIDAHAMISPSPCYVNHEGYVGGFEQADIDGLLETLESNYLGWSSTMAPAIMGAPNGADLSGKLTNSFCRTDPEIAKHFARVTFTSDYRSEMSKLKTPTLIVQCDDDLIAPVSVGEYMHKRLDHSVLRIIHNTGHCPHLSAPDATKAAMNEFLAEQGL